MGRTNATYRDLLRALEERWAPYRRGLRREDQVHFDQLFTHARNHADASGLRNHEEPIVPVLFSISLAQEKQLAALESRVERVENRAERVENRAERLEDQVETLASGVDGNGDDADSAHATDPEGAR